jgi:hypothetical protein
MKVKIQSLLKSILTMSVIVNTIGCTVIDTEPTPSVAPQNTSPLPLPNNNVNNIESNDIQSRLLSKRLS